MKILIRYPNWIGDAVLALPVLDSLKINFPDSEIWVAGRDWVKDIFSENEWVKDFISLAEAENIPSLRRSSRELRSFGFQTGLLLTNSFSSALLFFLAGIPERWGYNRDGRSLLLTRRVPIRETDPVSHQLNYYLSLLKGLGLKIAPVQFRIPLSENEKDAARKRLISAGADLGKPLVILSPGASYGPAKRWPAQKFGRLAGLFLERTKAQLAVIGSPGEKVLAEEISSSPQNGLLDFAGKTTLRELLALISQASLFITNDSGPMHLANALKVPVVAIFGPTDPGRTGPWLQPSAVIKREVPCWPCFYRKCPYDHRCLAGIEPEEVFEASRRFL